MIRTLIPLLYLLLLILFTACDDRSIVKVHDESVTKAKIPCLRLLLFPSDEKVRQMFAKQYPFDAECPLTFEVSQKSEIVCNSTHNSDAKALSAFPSSFLSIRIKKQGRTLYTYYVDLDDKVSRSDVEDAFSRIQKELILF